MQTPILIGLHAVKRGGKDTTAGFFEKLAEASDPPLTACRRGFADKGKLAFTRQFFPDITLDEAIEWVDRYKESGRVFRVPGHPRKRQYAKDVPFRAALAQFCTEGARDIYGDDFWVDQLLPRYNPYTGTGIGRGFVNPDSTPPPPAWHNEFRVMQGDSFFGWRPEPADICLIRDLRFENEVARIKELGGITVKIRRHDATVAVVEEARRQGREVHRSELGLGDEMFDFVINNDDNDMSKAFKRTSRVWDAITSRGPAPEED